MNRQQIAATRAVAARLIAYCDEAIAELSEQERGYYYIAGTKVSGALRRASLDLTRSLAEMRKP